MGEKAGCRWYSFAEAKFPADVSKDDMPKVIFDTLKLDEGSWTTCPVWSNGNHWLVMEGVTPEKMLPQGLGYWSPRLAARLARSHHLAQDARQEARLQRQGLAERLAGVYQRDRPTLPAAFIVGKDDQGEMHNAKLTNGSYDWKEVKQTITAPEGAIRMSLFFGLRPCKGEVDFDDININTASEGPATSETKSSGRACRWPRSARCDGSPQGGQCCRRLYNDGKGGWPTCPDADI